MFIWILVGIFCLSLFLSLFSLWRDLKKNIKTQQVTEELSKGRVIFHAQTVSDAQVPTTVSLEDKEDHQSSVHEEPSRSSLQAIEHKPVEEPTTSIDHHTVLPVSIETQPLHKEIVDSSEMPVTPSQPQLANQVNSQNVITQSIPPVVTLNQTPKAEELREVEHLDTPAAVTSGETVDTNEENKKNEIPAEGHEVPTT